MITQEPGASNPVVRGLITKGQNYTDEDRVQIIELQRNVIREIIPAYKKQFKNLISE